MDSGLPASMVVPSARLSEGGPYSGVDAPCGKDEEVLHVSVEGSVPWISSHIESVIVPPTGSAVHVEITVSTSIDIEVDPVSDEIVDDVVPLIRGEMSTRGGPLTVPVNRVDNE